METEIVGLLVITVILVFFITLILIPSKKEREAWKRVQAYWKSQK